MKRLLISLFAFAVIAMLSVGCQQGKPLNKECDILDITLAEVDWFVSSQISDSLVIITVVESADITSLTPIITITEGATIVPNSGVKQNFTSELKYTVTSEDGKWHKEYIVRVNPLKEVKNLIFNFNDWKEITSKGGNYWNPVEYWASGNPGIAVLRPMRPVDAREQYPTMRTDTVDDVRSGYAALMINQIGYGPMAGKSMPGYIVPGSLFVGSFNSLYALTNPLACPRFGMPIYCTEAVKPKTFKFWHKYKPGSVYLNAKGEVITDVIDECNIYSVVFDGDKPLTPVDITISEDGNRPIGSRIIGYAQLRERDETNGWKFSEIEYIYDRAIPSDVTIQLGIVITSSIKGDFFVGAIGSKLVVDDIEVIYTETKK